MDLEKAEWEILPDHTIVNINDIVSINDIKQVKPISFTRATQTNTFEKQKIEKYNTFDAYHYMKIKIMRLKILIFIVIFIYIISLLLVLMV